MAYEKISKDFFENGLTFEEYLNHKRMKPDDKKRITLYYDRIPKKFTKEELTIDLEHEINLMAIVAPWCWDCKTNIPMIARIAENSPKINIRYFVKEELPFVDKINGGEKIPQLLIFSEDFYFIDRWVERSTKGYELYAQVRKEVDGWKEENFQTFIKEYRKRFLKMQKEIEQSVLDEMKYIFHRVDAIQKATGRLHK